MNFFLYITTSIIIILLYTIFYIIPDNNTKEIKKIDKQIEETYSFNESSIIFKNKKIKENNIENFYIEDFDRIQKEVEEKNLFSYYENKKLTEEQEVIKKEIKKSLEEINKLFAKENINKENKLISEMVRVEINQNKLINKEEILDYLINQKDSEYYAKIKDYLRIERKKYSLPHLHGKYEYVERDLIDAAILYVELTKYNRFALFKQTKSKEEKIELISKLLATISKLESGGKIGFSKTAMSPSYAFGRFQIVGTTLGLTTIEAKVFYDIPVEKIDISDYILSASKGNPTLKQIRHRIIKKLLKEYEEDYIKRTGKRWSKRYYNKLYKGLKKYVWRTRVSLLTHAKTIKYKVYKNEFEDFKNQSLKIGRYYSEAKADILALKMLKFYKSPVNQAILSLIVFRNKMSLYRNINYTNKKSLTKLIGKTLKYYNADKKEIYYRGKKIKVMDKYALNGKEFFNSLY